MAIDHAVPPTRRALLAAGLGGLAATLASALGHAARTNAANGDSIVIGSPNFATGLTSLGNSTNGSTVFAAQSSSNGDGLYGSSTSGTAVHAVSSTGLGVWSQNVDGHGVQSESVSGHGVRGISTSGDGLHGESTDHYGAYGKSTNQAGVYGEATSHPGVVGTSTNSIGVSGTSPNGSGVSGSSGIGYGVIGHSNATNRAGSVGQSGGDATGVMGISGSPVPDAPAKTGVYGEATQDSTARGVWGKSDGGRGVYGQASSGHGVHGYATTGAAVFAQAAGPKKGLALRAVGRVRLDNAAGLATITSGTKSVVVTPGSDLEATSAVVATIQGTPSGSMTVRSVAIDAAADTFTIYLTANATSTVTVAWHVFS